MLSITTRSSSRSSRPIWRISRSATSRGPRIVQRAGRPVGEQPAAELEGGDQLGGLGRADPGDRGQLELRRPGPARSGRRGGRARPSARSTADRPRVPEPQTSAISSAAVRPADAAHGQPLARPLGRRAARGCARPRRRRPPVADGSCGSGHRGTSGRHGGGRGVPGPERREPADSPRHPDPRTRGAYRRALTGRLNRRCTAAHRRGDAGRRADRAATSARTSRIPLNAAWSPNDAQIVPRRTNSQPSARATGIRVGERRRRPAPKASPARRPRDRQRRGRRRRPARPGRSPARDARARGPRPSWRSPEQDLLAERRDHAPASSERAKPGGRRRSAAAG